MDKSDGIPVGTIAEDTPYDTIENAATDIGIRYQVERGGRRMMTVPCPVHWGVTPEIPKFWSARGNLEPVMTNKQEIMRFLLQPGKGVFAGDVPTENIAKYFGRKFGNVQRVSSSV